MALIGTVVTNLLNPSPQGRDVIYGRPQKIEFNKIGKVDVGSQLNQMQPLLSYWYTNPQKGQINLIW